MLRIFVFSVTLNSVSARKTSKDVSETIVNCHDSTMKIFYKRAEFEKEDKCISSSSSKDQECQPYYNHKR